MTSAKLNELLQAQQQAQAQAELNVSRAEKALAAAREQATLQQGACLALTAARNAAEAEEKDALARAEAERTKVIEPDVHAGVDESDGPAWKKKK